MMIGDRLRVMREGKNISQGEVDKPKTIDH